MDKLVDQFNQESFIENDPISIPRRYSKLQDIEISGFWTAILSWGLRKTIINKANQLFQLMDDSPYDFIVNHQEKDRKKFLAFKHRTFNDIDTLYFLEFLQHYYKSNSSLETLFAKNNIESGLSNFKQEFFSLSSAPKRTRKHISSPTTKSTCKRLNMFLRWMVREDNRGVDFGVWKTIKPSQLMMPLDVHVENQARKLGLLRRKQRDWNSVVELTDRLREFDPDDPVKYDFALFGLGIYEKQNTAP